MLELAIKNLLRQDEEEDLQRPVEISMQTLKDSTSISVGKTPRSARAKSKHLVAMNENVKLTRFQSLPLSELLDPSTDSGPSDE